MTIPFTNWRLLVQLTLPTEPCGPMAEQNGAEKIMPPPWLNTIG